jgi:predicted ABC-type ATPase
MSQPIDIKDEVKSRQNSESGKSVSLLAALPTPGVTRESNCFAAMYAEIRATMDYKYFPNYTLERQEQVQDAIIEKILAHKTTAYVEEKDICEWSHFLNAVKAPHIVFTTGCYGSGKSRLLKHLSNREGLNLSSFVFIDPDQIKRQLPEWSEYVKLDPVNAATKLHMESTFISLLAEKIALSQNRNIIVDGSLQNQAWYEEWFRTLKREYNYTIGILRVYAVFETCVQRCTKRAKVTSRVIPFNRLVDIYTQCESSYMYLKKLVDWTVEYDNNSPIPHLLAAHVLVPDPNQTISSTAIREDEECNKDMSASALTLSNLNIIK